VWQHDVTTKHALCDAIGQIAALRDPVRYGSNSVVPGPLSGEREVLEALLGVRAEAGRGGGVAGDSWRQKQTLAQEENRPEAVRRSRTSEMPR